jgi:hypothetical protein
MSIDSRLKTIQKQIDDNAELFQVMPNFSEWSEEQLNQYIEKWIKDFVIENKITCFDESETLLKKWLSKNLISEADYNLFIDANKEFWFNGASA